MNQEKILEELKAIAREMHFAGNHKFSKKFDLLLQNVAYNQGTEAEWGAFEDELTDLIEQARKEEREKQPMKMIKALRRQFEAGEGSERTKWEEKISARVKHWEHKPHYMMDNKKAVIKELESLLPQKQDKC